MNLLNPSLRRTSLLVVACVVALIVTAPAAPLPVQSFKKVSDGVTFTMLPGIMKLTICSDTGKAVEVRPVK